MKIEIKCRFSGSVLFSHECEGNTIKITLEVAVVAGANLASANLAGAYLAGAYLAGAYLAGANLAGANLAGANLASANLASANLASANLASANLAGANLAGAYLAGAYLAGANLAGANLAGAYLAGGEILKGERPILQIGPIGSRCAYFAAFLTDKGLRLRAGCFFGSREEFEKQLDETHEENDHAKEYKAALALIDCHAEVWTPKEGDQS
jgi:uncharacterized protein YjbI with pentapeptide repeats